MGALTTPFGGSGKVKTVNNIEPDANGNINIPNSSSSGSGGHTILNSSGSALTQREKLQFMNCTVSDSSDRTVVTPKMVIPVNPSSTPTENGSIWITT